MTQFPRWRFLSCLTALLAVCWSGCSSLQSIHGIPSVPANRLPGEIIGGPTKEAMIQISMSRLRQQRPAVYQLGPGDILGIYIETVLGEAEKAPPVHFPEDGSQPPAIGYPIPIREDGTVALPLVSPIDVAGLTLAQATDAIRKAYTTDQQILPEGKDRIIVTLIRRREHRVLVIREESGGAEGILKRGTGFAVDLPAYENDLLHALNATGGLPGIDAENEILIYHGGFVDTAERDLLIASLHSGCDPCMPPPLIPDEPNVVRIPIRYYPTHPPTFTESDIILQTGDIVLIRARDDEKFYTGGALPGGEFLLPRDYDLDILQAIAVAGGTLGSGGVGLAQAGTGGFAGGGATGASVAPSRAIVLRKLPNGGQVPIRINLQQALIDPGQRILIQPEDVIIVQYTFGEELYLAALNMIRFNFLFSGFSGRGM